MNQKRDNILLHICCGPCATIPIKELMKEFYVSSYFFNPNIYPDEEKDLRKVNAKKVSDYYKVDFFEDDEDYSFYLKKIKGKEENLDKERCKACYRMRLEKTAETAKKLKIETFSTSLLISPYQDIEAINNIGNEIAEKEGLKFCFKDFRPQFSESRVIAKELDLYRQKYCGCSFSRVNSG